MDWYVLPQLGFQPTLYWTRIESLIFYQTAFLESIIQGFGL